MSRCFQEGEGPIRGHLRRFVDVDSSVFRWFLASEDDTEEESSSRVELRPSEQRGQEPASLEERAEITSEDSSSVLTITSAVAGDRC